MTMFLVRPDFEFVIGEELLIKVVHHPKKRDCRGGYSAEYV